MFNKRVSEASLLTKGSCLAPTLDVTKFLMEQHALKNVNNCLNTNIYSYLETSGGQSSKPYLNVVHFFNTRLD